MMIIKEDAYKYVLDMLELCLTITETQKDFDEIKDSEFKNICHLSHRKYAEIYYFYKFYLITNKKVENIDISSYSIS